MRSIPSGGSLALAAVAGALTLVGAATSGQAAPGGPSGNGIQPVEVTGNPTCAQLGPDRNWIELRVQELDGDVVGGTYSDGTLSVDITVNTTSDGPTFDWTSDIGVDAVFSKGGPIGGNLYTYDPPSEETSDTGLHSPINPMNGKFSGLSHILFCYDIQLEINKDADTSFTRTYTWDIEKLADETTLTLAENQTFTVNYEVEVDVIDHTDSDWAVSGTITIKNPAPVVATVTDVTDFVDGTEADVDCDVDFPHDLAKKGDPGDTLECTYSTDLPDGIDRINTATVTTSGSVGGGEATADVIFGDPSEEVDKCIEVTDTNMTDPLGTVCVRDTLPMTFDYSLTFGTPEDADVQLECGENTHTNTASFVTNDTEATGSDDETVNATVECVEGCTLTQGYWKTHSREGPAPYDETWQELGTDEEDTEFFLSGKTYYEVLWTPPAGNVYYNLAHQYIAAELNQFIADIPADVLIAFDLATGLFETYTPAQIAALRGNNPLRQQFISLARTLDEYNNGISGPGHCTEDESSS